MVRGGCFWVALCIVASALLAHDARALSAPEGGLEVYRVWQSMADPAPIKVDIVPGWDIDDLMDNVEAKVKQKRKRNPPSSCDPHHDRAPTQQNHACGIGLS